MDDQAPPPLVLLACSDEWMGRSFASVFEQHGYAVARVSAGARTIRLARRSNPDVVVLEEGNGDLDALGVCTALGNDPLFDHAVPIVVTSTAPVTAATRHAAYAAGAWEYCSHPVDLEALMLKLATFRRARAEGAAKPAQRFIDRETGLYTAAALERLGEQVGARARRAHEPLACVTLGVVADREVPGARVWDDDSVGEGFAAVAEVCRVHSRKSDIVAHVSDSRLVILAPGTDGKGARLLVDRLRRALGRVSDGSGGLRDLEVRAGYSAVTDLADAAVDPRELVRQSATALEHLRFAESPEGLISFQELPPDRAD
jgi:DNA-binding response OmpR family regulator